MNARRSEADIYLNPISLAFTGANASLEAEFLEHYFNKSLQQMRLSILLGASLYALFAVLDAVLLPELKNAFWLIRGAVILLMVATVIASFRTDRFRTAMQPSLAGLILVSGMGIILMIVAAPAPVTDLYYAGLILVIFMGYTFIKARFIWASISCWVLVLIYEIIAVRYTRTPLSVLVNNSFFFVGANLIGMFAAYSIERMERRDFYLAALLQKEKENVQRINAELEERVRRRTDEIRRANRELIREIEERKKTESELRLIRAAIEQAGESVVISDSDGNIQYVNPAFEQISGYSRAEAVGMHARALHSDRQDPAYLADLQHQLAAGEAWAGRLIGRRKDGGFFEVETSIAPIRETSGRITHHVSVQRDMTQESELKRQLRQAQKMEAIGSLAGGIAHDFNNILVPIIGHAEIAVLDSRPGSQVQKSLREILKASARAKDLVGQILAFSRKSEIEFRPIRIDIVVREAVRLLRASIPPNIDIVKHISRDCGPIMGDPSQIHQVVMNLATNAYHAMAETGGTMTITLKEEKFDQAAPDTAPQMPPGEYVSLSLGDTGGGIEKTMIGKIFDPYFTTKPQGEGTGLGLSVVHGIVTGHGGRIFVSSHPGKGSRFTVYLPRVKVEQSPAADDDVKGAVGGSEHILVVDDEEAVTAMFRKMLSRLGYTVSVCATGREALERLTVETKPIDLLLTDYAMPGMNGIELAKRSKAMFPELPILLCTGFSEALPLNEMVAAGIADVILKPIFSNELDAKIRLVFKMHPKHSGNPRQPDASHETAGYPAFIAGGDSGAGR
ncbi:MAG: ATP-binding protein [Desulfobacterales bacterium]